MTALPVTHPAQKRQAFLIRTTRSMGSSGSLSFMVLLVREVKQPWKHQPSMTQKEPCGTGAG